MLTRICSRHHIEVPHDQYCDLCHKEITNPRDVSTMTPQERLEEFDSWRYTEVEFSLIHKRLEVLVGREIWTHELGLDVDGLRAEILGTKKHPEYVDEILDCIPDHIQVIPFDLTPSTTPPDN